MVTVRLFARLRERAGRAEIHLALDRPVDLGEFWKILGAELPQAAEWGDGRTVLVAVNREMASRRTLIRDGDEVALMPPFSGGEEPTSWTRIQAADFSVDEELRRIRAVSPRIGAVASFLGCARDFSRGRPVQGLSYEHFAGLAEKTLAGVRERALKQFPVIEILIIHRTGDIPIGGPIVLILAAAEHRDEAFRACRWCIDELKAVVPIWKKETTPQGEVWVEDRP